MDKYLICGTVMVGSRVDSTRCQTVSDWNDAAKACRVYIAQGCDPVAISERDLVSGEFIPTAYYYEDGGWNLEPEYLSQFIPEG